MVEEENQKENKQTELKIEINKKEAQREKIVMLFIYFVLAFGIIVLIFTAKSMFFLPETNNQMTQQSATQMPAMSRMSLTNYDKELARKMMDKNNDGKCDACGMPVEMCIDSGELQCSMGSKSQIGKLGSQHIHADWKVYINGKALDENFLAPLAMDMSKMDNEKTSSFIHLDSGAPDPEKTGDLLHMHATGIPLWIFFKSIDLELPNGVKAYVNGKEILDYQNYVFNDLDKILITDGTGDLKEQLDLITDFAKNH